MGWRNELFVLEAESMDPAEEYDVCRLLLGNLKLAELPP